MNNLSVENLSKSFNEKLLFNDLTFGIDQGQKVALVGINGCGKSTLLRLLSGQDQPNTGVISYRKGVHVAILDQQPSFEPGHTILDTVFDGSTEILKTIKAYESALAQLTHGADVDLTPLIENMDRLQAWDYESSFKQILGKLGIDDLELQVDKLSGGQKKRVALAKVLIQQPEFLILDEPTNHLDLEAIEWLEGYLATAQLSLIMVTHDRYFLEKVTNEVYEIDGGNLYKYKGNYVNFLEKRALREENESTVVDKAKNLMRKELEWMRRQPKARGTKSKSREDAFYELKDVAGKNLKKQQMEIKTMSSRQGKKIIEVDKVSKSFGNQLLIDNFTHLFTPGERLGIVGKNGVGKSTFIKVLTGEYKPDSGTLEYGLTTRIGHYTQEELALDESLRVIDVVKEVAEFIQLNDGSQVSVSQFLTLFQFPPATQYHYISKLSGGERRRLQLLLVLIQRPNFLILDEPTNDLDLMTLNILEDYLMNYPGCLLVVSHDRYFMDKLTDHLLVFEGEGKIRTFPGNYTDLREQRGMKKNEEPKPLPTSTDNTKVKTKDPVQKLSFNEQRDMKQMEKDIAKFEKEKASLVAKLNGGAGNHEEIAKWSKEINELTERIDEKELLWLELSERS